jgi:hypothetical protein
MYAGQRDGIPRAHLVFDRDFLWKYGVGIMPPMDRNPAAWVRRG